MLRDDPGVREFMHTAHAFDVDVAFGVNLVLELVVLDDVVMEVWQFHLEGLWFVKLGVQVEVLDIYRQRK